MLLLQVAVGWQIEKMVVVADEKEEEEEEAKEVVPPPLVHQTGPNKTQVSKRSLGFLANKLLLQTRTLVFR